MLSDKKFLISFLEDEVDEKYWYIIEVNPVHALVQIAHLKRRLQTLELHLTAINETRSRIKIVRD